MAFNTGTSLIISFGDRLPGHTLIIPPELTSYEQILDSLAIMTQATIESKLDKVREEELAVVAAAKLEADMKEGEQVASVEDHQKWAEERKVEEAAVEAEVAPVE